MLFTSWRVLTPLYVAYAATQNNLQLSNLIRSRLKAKCSDSIGLKSHFYQFDKVLSNFWVTAKLAVADV